MVLMGDGVYAALEGTDARGELLGTDAQVHLLRKDAAAAGIPLPTSAIVVIDMDGFVTLSERFPRQLCWY